MTAVQLGLMRTRVELLMFCRQRGTVFFSFLFPIVMLVLFGVVFGHGDRVTDRRGTTVPFSQYFLPGMLAAGIVLVSFQTVAIAITVERTDGTLQRLASTPLPPASYFFGKCGLVLVVGAVQAMLLLIVAATVFAVPLPVTVGKWLTFAWVFVLGTTAGGLLGVAFSSVARSATSVGAVVAAPTLVLQFISGVYFAFPDLPHWLQDVAAVFPLKWTAQGMRSVFLPGGFATLEPGGGWERGLTAVVLLAWAVVGLVLCLRTFRWNRG